MKIVSTRYGLYVVFISMIRRLKYSGRAYGIVGRKELKLKLLNDCVSNEVKFHKAKVWKIKHYELESFFVCSDGSELKASLLVDASGFTSLLLNMITLETIVIKLLMVF